MDFQQAEEEYKRLKARHKAGKLTEEDFKSQLHDLIVQDENGDYWLIGYETGRWHRHDGTQWVQADPPGDFLQRSTPVIPAESKSSEKHNIEDTAPRQVAEKATREKEMPPSPKSRSKSGVWGITCLGLLGLTAICVLVSVNYLRGLFTPKDSYSPTRPAATLYKPPAGPSATTQPPAATEALPATEAPAAGGIDCMGAAKGDEISMIYHWTGQEDTRFNEILQPLVDACGIVLKPESASDSALLDTRVKAGTPPDIAFWNVTQLNLYKDRLFAMDTLGASQDPYIPGAVDPGIIDGRWLGLPVNSYLHSLIWCSNANFDALGYNRPYTWEDLDALVEKMAADGRVPWSMGLESGDATGWTGASFIQDILLVQQGPDYVKGLINGSIPYDDAGVQQAYLTYGKWAMDPKYSVGGAQGTLTTHWADAILKPFFNPPEAMMVKQGHYAGEYIAGKLPDLKYDSDYDLFVFPGIKGLQVSTDFMMAFSDKPAVKALVTYLASAEGAANWARAGLGLSPNKNAEPYYNTASAPASALYEESKEFYHNQVVILNLEEAISGGFAAAEWKSVVYFLSSGDLASALAQVRETQMKALGK